MNFSQYSRPQDRPVMVMAYADSCYAARCVRMFRRLGWEVHMAANLGDTLRLVRLHAPELVVVDTESPESGGWKTKLQLRRDFPQQRVVVLTPRHKIAAEPHRDEFDFFPEDANADATSDTIYTRAHLEAV